MVEWAYLFKIGNVLLIEDIVAFYAHCQQISAIGINIVTRLIG